MGTNGTGDPAHFSGRGQLDAHTEVYGLRNWRIDTLFRLTGMVYKNSVWKPGVNVARCMSPIRNTGARGAIAGYVGNQAIPMGGWEIDGHTMQECPHGFYAYYDGSRDYHQRGDVTGVIKGWGEGEVGDKGFRVEFAEIVAIKFSGGVTPQQRERIQRIYPAVDCFQSFDKMLAKWPTTAGELEYIPEVDEEFWTREA